MVATWRKTEDCAVDEEECDGVNGEGGDMNNEGSCDLHQLAFWLLQMQLLLLEPDIHRQIRGHCSLTMSCCFSGQSCCCSLLLL